MTSALPTFIENHPFDEIRIGDSASLVRTLETADLQLFATGAMVVAGVPTEKA